MSENKTKPTTATVEDFIEGIENKRRKADALTCLAIYEQITGQPAVIWGPSIIGFGTFHYKYESGREGDVPAASFSPRKANLVFYVGTQFDGADALYKQLGKHRRSVACLYINKLDDIDLEVLKQIIELDYQNPSAC